MTTGANNPHNRLRQLKGLVTIDAWHEWNPQTVTATLHAYIHFDTARLGGEGHDEIAFRLQLRNAEIKLLQSEPKSYEIDPKKIWRGDKDGYGKIKRQVERVTKADRSRGASAKIDMSASALSIQADGRKSSEETMKDSFNFESEVANSNFYISFIRNSKDQPTWVIKPGPLAPENLGAPYLKGQAWDDKLQQMITMKADKRLADQELLSSLRLCLICRSEDLIFFDIKIRNKNGNFFDVPFESPHRMVVQEYLRKALIFEGLNAGDMDSPFSIITLGEAVSEPRTDIEDV